LVLGMQEIGERKDKWPIMERLLYPTSHDWDGTSIPDLTEDKQRARAVAQNLAMDAFKFDVYATYLFDSTKIKNRNDLNPGMNKFIPVSDGSPEGAVVPLRKAAPNMNLLDFIYQSIDASAQKATATPELQQGAISSKERTLGELNLVSSKVDTRYSLSAKVFGWSEKAFWTQHYHLYKKYFPKGIDEKVLRLVGAFGSKWRPLRRENIICEVDPDIKIESKVLSRAKQMEERDSVSQYMMMVLQDPTVNRRYAYKNLGKYYNLKSEEIGFLFPKTIDERIAEQQNVMLSEDKVVPVLPEDDHNVHLEIHAKAADTPATFAHIKTHEEALSIKKTNPELFPMPEQQAEATSFGNQQQNETQYIPGMQNKPRAVNQGETPARLQ